MYIGLISTVAEKKTVAEFFSLVCVMYDLLGCTITVRNCMMLVNKGIALFILLHLVHQIM